jgi:hypothetical protein
MKTNHFIFSCILATLVFSTGCQQEVSPLLPEGENDGIQSIQSESLLIDPAITELSEIHAQNVARLFRQKSIGTKAGGVTLTTITETVTPILDEEGDPLMYVINFADNGGFTIVSATKSYYPILAYADEGHFDCPEVLPGGIDIWVTERKEEILYCKENEASLDTSFKLMWNEYEMQAEAPPMTRTEISDATSALLSAWTANGYAVTPLSARSIRCDSIK